MINFAIKNQKKNGILIIPIILSYQNKYLNLLKKISQYYQKIKFINNIYSTMTTINYIIFYNFNLNNKKKHNKLEKNNKNKFNYDRKKT